MKKDKALTKVTSPAGIEPILNQAQLALVNQKTPGEFIKIRKGPNNRELSYVEGGYIVRQLNDIFGYDWDFVVLREHPGQGFVTVLGELTVRTPSGKVIKKTQYGGAEIKRSKDGKIIDPGNDMKAAATDSLKKCASLLGIAGDVYWRDTENYNALNGGTTGEDKPKIDDNQRKRIFALIGELGLSKEEQELKHSKIKLHYGKESLNELASSEAQEVIGFLQKQVDEVQTKDIASQGNWPTEEQPEVVESEVLWDSPPNE